MTIKEIHPVSSPTKRIPCSEKVRKMKQNNFVKGTNIKKLFKFWTVKVIQLLCVIYILVLTFSKAPIGLVDPNSGNIIDVSSPENTENGVILVNGDYRPVVAIGTYQKICLAISRISAFSMYPVLVLVFLSKCKATISLLNKSPLSMYMIKDNHDLHTYAGRFIAFDVWVHTLFHLLRWADQGNISLLWEHRAGLSGLVAVIVTPIISFPMLYWKQAIPYEIRKGLHYLFYAFAIGLCFHVPPSGIPNGGFIAYILGFCICFYTLDALYIALFMTEKIETTIFHELHCGVLMTLAVSKRFQDRGEKGGFGYICLPWVSRNQWHAYSLFQHPSEPNKRQVFILDVGDWTHAVHGALQRNTVRPSWIQGPFSNPYCEAEAYDNTILVATGIGITPALSVIQSYKDSRRCNLIWAVRDPSMLEFFMDHLYLDHDGWNLIFYTGKKPLNPALEELDGTNIRLIKGRPDLNALLPNIIYGIESSAGRPETFTKRKMVSIKQAITRKMSSLEHTDGFTEKERLKELTNFANRQGFILTEFLNELEDDQSETSPPGSSAWDLGVNTDKSADSPSVSFCIDEDAVPSPQQLEEGFKDEPKHESQDMGLKLSRAPSESDYHAHEKISQLRQVFATDIPSRRMSQALVTVFNPWEKNANAEPYVKNLCKESVLSTWGVLYCGGNKFVRRDLKRISSEYGVSLNLESFAW